MGTRATYIIPPVRLIGRLALSYASSLDLFSPIDQFGSLNSPLQGPESALLAAATY